LYLMIAYRHRVQLTLLAAAALLVSLPLNNIWLRFPRPDAGRRRGRLGIWKIRLTAFQQHPLAGIGTGQFRLAYSDAYLQILQRGNFHPWVEDSISLLFGRPSSSESGARHRPGRMVRAVSGHALRTAHSRPLRSRIAVEAGDDRCSSSP